MDNTKQGNIKNLIFDLGGVLLNIDYERTIVAFEDLGIRDFRQHFTQFSQIPLFDKLETGQINGKTFLDGLKKLGPEHITHQDLIRAWNAMLLDFPDENIEFLKESRKHYRMFLLSNTNVIHLRAFNNLLNLQYEIDSLNDFFEDVYFSHEIGYRKPDPEAFLLILKEKQLEPGETLFIDDLEQNLEGAKKTGIQTYHKKAGESWDQLIKTWNLKTFG